MIAVGQKLAKRLGDQIKRTSAKMKKIVKVYNASSARFDAGRVDGSDPCALPSKVLDAEAFDTAHAMYLSIQSESEADKQVCTQICTLYTEIRVT